MDEQRKEELQETQQSGYIPRPSWQVWGARIGLAVFLILLVLYYLNVFRGGL